MAELDGLIAGAEQFLWGSADLAAGVPELLERLRAAKAWVSKACAQARCMNRRCALASVVPHVPMRACT